MNSKKRIIIIMLSFVMIIGALFQSVAPDSFSVNANEQDPVNRILCKFEDGKKLANLQPTDYFHYLFRSKSAITSMDSVNTNWMNKLLTVAGFEFEKNNEAILGRPINPTSIPDEPGKVNSGPKVSAFDRFGMAGLKWSSYQGEWKYNHVDVCSNQGEVSPTTYGTFYEGRLEPKSTHNEVPTSKDPRTIQFDRGAFSLVATSARDLLANFLFGISKLAVTITITFVGLAFSDITSLMGMSVDGSAGVSSVGMWLDLFDTIFTAFVVFAIIVTALYILYNGIIKRQARLAINTIIKTILIFTITIVISLDPAMWISLPNKIATYGQAIVLSSMSGMYNNDIDYPTLCSTDIGSMDEGVNLDGKTDEAGILTEFEKINQNMKSLIGCQMWEQLLFKPWVRGQFGTEYENLNDDKLTNVNKEWVGSGSVPIGDGQTIDNWALFHLSTQTNAHSQIGEDNFPTLVTGINADWWRTADALSNYQEGQVSDSIGGDFQGEYVDQIKTSPTDYWQSWAGNNSVERLGVAVIAVFFSIAGSAAPLVFSVSSAVFGFGITLLMMFSPFFLLLGLWGGTGDKIFLGWLSALANTMIKRIGVSILLILSITLSMNIMNLVYTVGFIQSFILMVLVTVVLIKNKNKMLAMLASVDLGGIFDPRQSFSTIVANSKKNAINTYKIGNAAAVGAVTGIKTGQGLAKGSKIGAQSQLKNLMYQYDLGRTINREIKLQFGEKTNKGHICIKCNAKIGYDKSEVAYADENENIYCLDCADEIGTEELFEFTPNNETEDDRPLKKDQTRNTKVTKNRSYLSHKDFKHMMESEIVEGKLIWNESRVQGEILSNMKHLREDIVVFHAAREKYKMKSRPPSLPEPLHKYVDIALLNKAWTDGRIEVVEQTYKEAWKSWYKENSANVGNLNPKEKNNFLEKIDEYSPDITEDEARKIVMEDLKQDLEKDKNDIYIYRNGELVLNSYEKRKYKKED